MAVERRGGWLSGHVTWVCSVVQNSSAVNFFTTPPESLLCACAMTDAADILSAGAEDSLAEQSGAASAASSPPMPAPSESSSAPGSSTSVLDQQSDLLMKIKDLVDTQKALKAQRKQCAMEMKNAMKRKKRLQGKASQLSDADLVEVLRMRKAKKESAQAAADTPPSEI